MFKRRHLWCFLALGLLSGALLECKREEEAAPAGGKPSPAGEKGMDIGGIYLMGTGFSGPGLNCLKIQKDEKGNLVVEEIPKSEYSEWRAEYRNGRLAVAESQRPSEEYGWIMSLEFQLSRTVPGDYDLAHVSYSIAGAGRGTEPQPREASQVSLEPPVLCYLHRHEDKRIAEYYVLPSPSSKETKDNDEKISRRLDLASALVADHPEELYSRILYMQTLGWRKDWVTLAAQVKEWEPRLAESNLARPLNLLKNNLRAHDLSTAGRNAADLLSSLFDPPCDLAAAYQRFPGILNYSELAVIHNDRGVPNFLPRQIMAKVFNAGAVFLMLEGRREDALTILSAGYHQGQLMGQSDSLIMRLIGCAVGAIACRSLELFALDCCEAPAECEQMWKMLERLNQWEKTETVEDLFQFEGPGAPHLRPAYLKTRIVQRNAEEAITRFRCTRSHFQLIRAAVAARHHFLRTAAFPQQAADFAPLLPAGPPPDPHKPAEALRFHTDADQFLCYSVGPDQKDDAGSILYDPTNGTKSRGDIVVRMPRERKYPFPRGGVRAANREDLLRQFPNGLPPDPFADTKGKPLEVSNTFPVYVYSYGPDTDESGGIEDPQTKQRRKRAVTDFPEVAYDPTNGTTSNGDLFMEIPSR
jgi:hypothetical protein